MTIWLSVSAVLGVVVGSLALIWLLRWWNNTLRYRTLLADAGDALVDVEQVSLAKRSLEQTRSLLLSPEGVAIYLPYKLNSDEFESAEKWEVELRRVAEALLRGAEQDLVVFITSSTDKAEPVQGAGQSAFLKKIMDGRALRVKSILQRQGLPDDHLRITFPQYLAPKSNVIIKAMPPDLAAKKEHEEFLATSKLKL
eukprot:TRINITY_DN76580_c0_g1_i1.p1 TRINITY_DN76580_c0_g1~~TRINITY_DN76580_c0_g1_i1.p1  ORF type:complete len:216 (-),score=61.55 TRINITY_DN76580_c0_g1_i1:397-987(-)